MRLFRSALLALALLPGWLPAEDVSPLFREKAMKFFEVVEIEKPMRVAMHDMMVISLMGGMDDPGLKAAAETLTDKVCAKIDTAPFLDDIVKLYAQHFTVEDIEAVTAFYQSPSGHKFASLSAELAQGGMQLGQAWGKREMPRVLALFKPEIASFGEAQAAAKRRVRTRALEQRAAERKEKVEEHKQRVAEQ
jgi:hypothetical protein